MIRSELTQNNRKTGVLQQGKQAILHFCKKSISNEIKARNKSLGSVYMKFFILCDLIKHDSVFPDIDRRLFCFYNFRQINNFELLSKHIFIALYSINSL